MLLSTQNPQKGLIEMLGLTISHRVVRYSLSLLYDSQFEQMPDTLKPAQKSDWKSYMLPTVHAYNATRLGPSAESDSTQAEHTTLLLFIRAARQTERYKVYYDQKVRESKLEIDTYIIQMSHDMTKPTK